MGVTSTAGAKAYAAVFINSPETTVVFMSEMLNQEEDDDDEKHTGKCATPPQRIFDIFDSRAIESMAVG